VRVGLSATQKPIEAVADFLVGAGRCCEIIDVGHGRARDLALEVPPVPLEAVMSNDVWARVYDRLAILAGEHRTTLVFVNTRRMAERAARHLSERLGNAVVAAHHGSLAREQRLDAEQRLKRGELRVLVATASLELGIDIGDVELVCQLGSPRSISAFLQRVGRAGHQVGGVSKGRLFPDSRDDLIECAALLDSVRRGELDTLVIPIAPLDVLAQQIVAEVSGREWQEDALLALIRRAMPYAALREADYQALLAMLAAGYTTRHGARGAYLHRDLVSRSLRGRRGGRLTALTSGGTIADNADYSVLLEPQGFNIGTVNEDFAVESLAGDVFQLGNTSYRIIKIESGRVRVEDAQGQPPNIPFWLGEAPARSDEMSAAVSRLRAEVDVRLPGPDQPRVDGELDRAIDLLMAEYRLSHSAAEQIAQYLVEGKRALGVVPTTSTIALERFFDESGGMQLVLHAPFGSRVNRAWGLALRKKFCQSFNFELQAAATEEGIILSLGPVHSFPLLEVFRYLRSNTVRETLVQAVLDSPIFETRWRWVATLSLAVPRMRNGARVPAQLQRMYAEDLLQSAFPDAVACLENIPGAREIPDHPLVEQALRDSLEEAMDLPRLVQILERLERGEIACAGRDTPEPSVFSHELLNSAVYTFLDDAPLEERRTQAVYTRRATEPRDADDLGALDPAAIERVRAEAWPVANTADELHDALLLAGCIRQAEAPREWRTLLDELIAAGRAVDTGDYWVALERFQEFDSVVPQAACPEIPERLRKRWTREDAAREIVRSRMEVSGPLTARRLADTLQVGDTRLVDGALLALENEGRVLRGRFTAQADTEWCDRRLLARIHRYTLNRLRAEIEPVSAVDFVRFLLHWQHVTESERVMGAEGLSAVITQLDGYEVAAAAWEREVLPARVRDYGPEQLDMLCLSGRVAWGRRSPAEGGRAPLASSPVALMVRERAAVWQRHGDAIHEALTSESRAVCDALRTRGASFFHELVAATGLLRTQVERALGELAGAGLVTADSFSGLRALLTPSEKRKRLDGGRASSRQSVYGVDTAGRWALLAPAHMAGGAEDAGTEERTETIARTLLRRYGVVFRALLARESALPPWRELVMVYRRLEARGEIRGGRFASGFGGEQFAAADAVGRLRAVRKQARSGELVVLSASDPLNLVGVLTPDARVAASGRNRMLFRDGLAIAAMEGGRLRRLAESDMDDETLRSLLARRAGVRELRDWLRAPTQRELERTQKRRAADAVS